MEALFTAENLVALLSLTILEIVLGVDNIIFLAIVTAGLPEDKQPFARRLGLTLALLGRIIMVLGISWLMQLDTDLFTLMGHTFSLEEVILLGGGIFLVYKAVTEIYKTTELKEEEAEPAATTAGSMAGVIAQIVVVDMIFAIDSVLTAVGLTQEVWIIIVAMTIAILVMMFFAEPLSKFINDHPSLKMLALSFLVLVGVLLISDGFGEEINRSYVYFAILFSLAVEALNFRRQANLQRQKNTQGPTGV
jgi:predicted tellurium resistance membrane protein TerC